MMNLFDFTIGGQSVTAMLTILLLAYFQNVSFSIVSRSRNRNNMTYHLIASVLSNGVWFVTFRELVMADMTFIFFIPYTIGTVSGSISGAKVSMWIEKKIGAVADTPKEKPVTLQDVSAIIAIDKLRQELYLLNCTVGPSDAFLRAIQQCFNVELDPNVCINEPAHLYKEILKLEKKSN